MKRLHVHVVVPPSQPAYAVPEPTYYLSRPMYRHVNGKRWSPGLASRVTAVVKFLLIAIERKLRPANFAS